MIVQKHGKHWLDTVFLACAMASGLRSLGAIAGSATPANAQKTKKKADAGGGPRRSTRRSLGSCRIVFDANARMSNIAKPLWAQRIEFSS